MRYVLHCRPSNFTEGDPRWYILDNSYGTLTRLFLGPHAEDSETIQCAKALVKLLNNGE